MRFLSGKKTTTFTSSKRENQLKRKEKKKKPRNKRERERVYNSHTMTKSYRDINGVCMREMCNKKLVNCRVMMT